MVIVIGVFLTCLPPTGVNVGEILKYEFKLISGAVVFIAIGYIFYAIYQRNKKVSQEIINPGDAFLFPYLEINYTYEL